MSAYARINRIFESEDALTDFEKEYTKHFRTWFPDIKRDWRAHRAKITADAKRLFKRSGRCVAGSSPGEPALLVEPCVTNSILPALFPYGELSTWLSKCIG